MLKFPIEKQRVGVKGAADSKGGHGLFPLAMNACNSTVSEGPPSPLQLCCLGRQAPQSCYPFDTATLETACPCPQHLPALLVAASAMSSLGFSRAVAKPYNPALPSDGLQQPGMEALRI